MAKIFPIFEAQNSKRANVVFFHGLGGDPFITWGAAKGSKDDEHFWPRWLEKDVEGLSVYSVAYEATPFRWNGSAMHLIDRALNCLDLLLHEPGLGSGPLVLVGHSMGGLIIKQLIRTADSEALLHPDARRFLERVEKVAFLATPHGGSSLASTAGLLRIILRPSPATASLVQDDPHLRDLRRWYCNWANSRNIVHLALAETKRMGFLGIIVDQQSANPGLACDTVVPVDSDHITIAKPKNRESEIYVRVRRFLESTGKCTLSQSHKEAQIDMKHRLYEAA
jgi:pimeloyl-ACP methyl ester carboxylesterase